MQVSFDIGDFPEDLDSGTREAEFLRLFVEAYRNIYACALSIVVNRADVEDVIQEVCVVLWQKFDEFEPGTNFTKWATTITFNVSKTFARRKRSERGFGLNDQILGKLARIRVSASELYELRREKLRECLSRLPAKDQRFLQECYRKHTTLVAYSQASQIPIATIYTRLKRLRKRLAECVRLRMSRDGDEA